MSNLTPNPKIVMRKIACFTVCLFLFATFLQAANVPSIELKGHTEEISFAAFSSDGKKIVTVSEDETARIWDVDSGKELHKQKLAGRFLAVSQDGKRIITHDWENDRTVYRIWSTDTGKMQAIKPKGEPLDVMFCGFVPDEARIISSDGKKLLTALGDDNGNSITQIWDTDTGRELRRLGERGGTAPLGRLRGGREGSESIHTALFSPDGKKIMTQASDTIRVLDASSGKELFNVKGFTGDFSPDGSKFFTVNTEEEGDTVRIWDANSGKKITEIKGALALKFSPDGKKIVTQSLEEDTIRMWDTNSGKELYELEVFPGGFSPDGKKVVTTDSDTTQIFDADSRKELQELKGNYLAFSPDGKKIATATGNIVRIWTIADSADSPPKGDLSNKAKALLKQAEQGEAEAQYELGKLYKIGYGVPKDVGAAAMWFQKAAVQGHAAAQFEFGYCYRSGKGVLEDDTAAAAWFLKSAEQGNTEAQSMLGTCYLHGTGVPKDLAESAKWFRTAAEQGDTWAQWTIGVCYSTGAGVPKDDAEAVKWVRKAADQGVAEAQQGLGGFYYFGLGVPEDHTVAVTWFRKAAEQNLASAQFALGLCYARGHGVKQDDATAVTWFRKAAEQGHEEAIEILKPKK